MCQIAQLEKSVQANTVVLLTHPQQKPTCQQCDYLFVHIVKIYILAMWQCNTL
jgi:hypothetical protein